MSMRSWIDETDTEHLDGFFVAWDEVYVQMWLSVPEDRDVLAVRFGLSMIAAET